MTRRESRSFGAVTIIRWLIANQSISTEPVPVYRSLTVGVVYCTTTYVPDLAERLINWPPQSTPGVRLEAM
jgi:hypothetical protein